ncbi:MAG: GntR family transcriptional regulator [Gordonia sp.]|jgi:DNA-binding FadR family transcriptional regulator|uniref:FadR/GntR family transcriptional regulator n=1 Tax=Gordonia rubripertincta TaxID=36822 RepID=A0ABT4N3U5_GORRU|nr:FadR/GntR family transcriptional regulator [Gordonia rubripertincta]MBA4021535.1 GntR family transcriptional regulator [Gordonia sp. (in: high G+C Gram-positive bacteria)]MCZ4553932.1 FadR/GntR family transcriptional regulator [Gordonia rubripertincta]
MTAQIQRPRRTSEVVVDRMQELIRTGEWPVGARIPAEPELVEQLGVGRNTIREAVRALEHSGFLEPRRGDGTYVRSRNLLAAAISRCVSSSEVLELLQVRRALEREAAQSAARNRTDAQVRSLRELLIAMRSAFEADDLQRYIDADIAFHTTLVAAAGNALLSELYDGVAEVMSRTHATLIAADVDAHPHPTGHAEVVDAVAAGDSAGALAAVDHYLDRSIEALS